MKTLIAIFLVTGSLKYLLDIGFIIYNAYFRFTETKRWNTTMGNFAEKIFKQETMNASAEA